MIRSGYKWSDSFQCINGNTVIDQNYCFLGLSASLEDLRIRGIRIFFRILEFIQQKIVYNIVTLSYIIFLNVCMYVCYRFSR